MTNVPFGPLPVPISCQWSTGSIATVPDYEDVIAWLEKYAHIDSYLYPPEGGRFTGSVRSPAVRGTAQRRPSLLYRVPATHAISADCGDDDRDWRLSKGSAQIHYFGMLYGFRVQWADWWFDGRIDLGGNADARGLPSEEAAICMDHLAVALASWNAIAVTRLTAALVLHHRAFSYEWDWERFAIQYQVFDALFRIACDTHRVRAKGHADRLAAMAARFGLTRDSERFRELASQRNELIHEALWQGSMPDGAFGDRWHFARWLYAFNRRLLLAIVGVPTEYIQTPWWGMGSWSMRVARSHNGGG